jgi:Raf kinase inhibitor-like YbhB/YbcL family protein
MSLRSDRFARDPDGPVTAKLAGQPRLDLWLSMPIFDPHQSRGASKVHDLFCVLREIADSLRSSIFEDGMEIPRRFTCEGGDASPPLHWSDALPTTRSFVVLCDGPDAPAGTWHHWAAYDIPVDRTTLPEAAAGGGGKDRFKQALNDSGRPDYGGPCPPHGPHHYSGSSPSPLTTCGSARIPHAGMWSGRRAGIFSRRRCLSACMSGDQSRL